MKSEYEFIIKDDRTRCCDCCGKKVKIRFNQVGGFWHLSGWEDKNGEKHTGGYCSDCFHKMSTEKRMVDYEKTYGRPYKGIGK